MTDSWIAITDRCGLMFLELETENTVELAQRIANRRNAESFWAVLTLEQAFVVKEELTDGNSHAALELLQTLALHTGRLTPVTAISRFVTNPDDRDREWNH